MMILHVIYVILYAFPFSNYFLSVPCNDKRLIKNTHYYYIMLSELNLSIFVHEIRKNVFE